MISVVIPAYNEEKLLKPCFDSLINQRTEQPFEVIFIDNNSTDNTKNIALSYKKHLDIHIFTEKQKGRGAARKLGFSKASGSIILSTDADVLLPQNWIDRLTKPFMNQSIIAVTGTCNIQDCSWVTNFLFNTLYQPFTELFYRIFEKHWCLIGPNFAVRKEAYFDTSGFDSGLNCREDADLSAKIAKIGRIQRINLSVTFSGRRYAHGLILGAVPYLINRVKELFIGRQNIILDDVR